MTTPAQSSGPALTITADKASYNAGDTLTLTASYADEASQPVTLTITATATDASGSDVQATTSVTVTEQETEAMTVSATDSFGDTYSVVSNDGKGTAVLTTVITPPAAS